MKITSDQYLWELHNLFSQHGNKAQAEKMKAYMRNQFEFLGIASPLRKELQRRLYANFGKPEGENAEYIAEELWEKDEREYQYAAMDILDKSKRSFKESSIHLLEKLVLVKSWWDTIDFLSAGLAGFYFGKFPHRINPVTQKWMDSGNIWLQRSCLLFQLKYKNKTDTRLLYSFIESLRSSDEFFIRKAIGWILREYSKTNPEEVQRYVNSTELKPLSRTEALKVIKRKKA